MIKLMVHYKKQVVESGQILLTLDLSSKVNQI